jgi:hypothetical protein
MGIDYAGGPSQSFRKKSSFRLLGDNFRMSDHLPTTDNRH